MTEQQEKKDAPAPAPPVHKENILDTRLLSEAVIELNIQEIAFLITFNRRSDKGTGPVSPDHYDQAIRYQVPA